MKEWKLIGKFSVDAGMVYIGDPCYLADDSDGTERNPFRHWKDNFCKKLKGANWPTTGCIDWKDSITGKGEKGVFSNTGIGDGIYPVWALIENDRIVLEIRIFFGDPNTTPK